MSNVDKVLVAVSRGNYTVYTQKGKLFGETTYKGRSNVEMSKKRTETSEQYNAESEFMPYEIIGKRRTAADAVAHFSEDKVLKIRKDLVNKALNLIGRSEDTVAIVYHGPFAYIKEIA